MYKCLYSHERPCTGLSNCSVGPTGLRSSRCFVALISRAGLARVRDPAQSHKYDNVLLEYETALNVRRTASYNRVQ